MKLNAHVENPIRIDFSKIDLADQYMKQLGAHAIDTMTRRVGLNLGTNDSPMPQYSGHGPIYVPLTGTKKGRTKTKLKGVEVITAQDLAKLRKSGLAVPSRSRKAFSYKTYPRLSRTGNSVVFRDWEQYKQSLGKSGRRDLELSGRMLGAITIVELSDNRVVIGFTRDLEMLKAQGNDERSEWFGLSPNDGSLVVDHAQAIWDQIVRTL